MSAAEKLEELLSIDRVCELTGVSRAYIYIRIGKKTFPRPIKVGKRSLWLMSEVQAWIAAEVCAFRENETGTKRAPSNFEGSEEGAKTAPSR